MAEIRLHIIARDLLVRTGLATLMDSAPDLRVVGRSVGAETLADDITLYQPDVALLDIGYQATTEELRALRDAELPAVVLIPNAEDASAIYPALAQLSAYALLLRDTSAIILAQAVQAVICGLVVFSPALMDALQPTLSASAPPPLLEDLTSREREVLALLAEGLMNKAIGERLHISANTVKFHVNAILSKLDAHSRTEAVVKATQLGLILL